MISANSIISKSPNEHHLTDLGNSERLADRHGDKIRYVNEWGWMVWDGKHWKRDATNYVTRLAKETIKHLYEEANELTDDRERLELIDHARKSEAAYRIKAMVELAQSERGVVASSDDFDTYPFLLTVNNGTIDLTTGQLQQHNPNDLITKLAPVDYDPDAKSEVWQKFIQDITKQDNELQEYLQRIAGYSLTGDTREHAFFILYGAGRNGKSSFLNALQQVMGDYAKPAQANTFMQKSYQSGVNNDLAALVGTRLVTTVETGIGKHLDVEMLKLLTGGDRIAARFLYRETFTLTPQFKIFMATNNKPEIDEQSQAIWSRTKLIPFEASFAGREDNTIPDKLKAAASAILIWAVQGCLKWQKDGLTEPEVVKQATKEYRDEQDELSDFFAEKCELGDYYQVKARSLYDEYKLWCDSYHIRAVSNTVFGSQVIQRGFQRKRNNQGIMYQGIKLVPPQFRLNIPAYPITISS